MMEQGLVTVLAGSPPIADGRVYPRLPQNVTFPAVRFQRISTRRTTSVDGVNVGPTEFTIQIDCFGHTYAASKGLADEVRSRLHTYRGAWGTSVCLYCILEAENDLDEQDGDRITHWVSQRFLIWTDDE